MFKLSNLQISSLCNRVISACVYLVILVVPSVFALDQGNFNIFELNKLVVFRTLLSLALLSSLLQIIVNDTWRRALDWRILWPLLLLAGYALISLLYSLDPVESFFGNYMRQQGLHSLLYYWLWFVLLLAHWQRGRQVQGYLLAASLSSVPVIIYALVQKFGFDWLLWSEPGTGRVFSSLGQPNFLAYYLVSIIFFTLACALFLTKLWQRLLLSLLVVLQLIVLILSSSRGAVLGLLIGLLVLLLLNFWHTRRRRFIFYLLSGLLVLLVSVYFLFNQLVVRDLIKDPIIARYSSVFHKVEGSSRVRLFYWRSAWQEFQSSSWPRRLFGYGKDSQRFVYLSHYQAEWGLHEKLNSYPDRAHNLVIDLYLEFGLVGLLLFALFNLCIIIRALVFWHSNRGQGESRYLPYLLAATSAYFISNLFGFSLTTHYLYYYLLLALLWCLSAQLKPEVFKLPFSKLFAYLVFSSLALFSLFCLWQFTLKYFLADRYFMLAKKSEAQMNCVGVIHNVNLANDWQASHYYQEQFLFMYNNCLPLVDQPTRKAMTGALLEQLKWTDERPWDYDYTLNLARSYSILGLYLDKVFYQSATRHYQALIQLSPDILSAYQDYGRMLIWAGDYAQAELILRQGIARSPMQLAAYQSSGYQALTRGHTYYLWQLVGDSAYHQGHFTEALQIYHDIEAQRLVSLELYKNIADSYYQLKNYQKTREYLVKALSLAPGDQELLASINQLDQLLQKGQ